MHNIGPRLESLGPPPTVAAAKQEVRRELEARGVVFERLTAKTVSFYDLARCSAVFVTVHGPGFAPACFEDVKAATSRGVVVKWSPLPGTLPPGVVVVG